ncbi:unnamed protein product, partial [Closterium sp. NIES-54]
INFFLLRQLLGVRTEGTQKQAKVLKLTKGEVLMLNIGSMSTVARVVAVKNDLAKLHPTRLSCSCSISGPCTPPLPTPPTPSPLSDQLLVAAAAGSVHQGHGEAGQGGEADQGRGADAQHRVHVYWCARGGGQERSRQAAPHLAPLSPLLPSPAGQINFFLLRRLLGVRTKGTEKQGKVAKLTKGEVLMLNIGSMSTGARVVAVKNDLAKLHLTSPVCTKTGEKLALSRRVEKHWRLIGWGQIQAGVKLDVPPPVDLPK